MIRLMLELAWFMHWTVDNYYENIFINGFNPNAQEHGIVQYWSFYPSHAMIFKAESMLGIWTFARKQKLSAQIETYPPNVETWICVLTIRFLPHLNNHRELVF